MSNIPIIQELEALVQGNDKVMSLLVSSITSSKTSEVGTLSDYYLFLEQTIAYVPFFCSKRDFYNTLVKFFWFLNNPFGKALQGNVIFRNWLLKFFQKWEEYLDTPESLGDIECLDMNITQFNSFNDFINRGLLRLVDEVYNDNVLVFPGDGVLREVSSIKTKSQIKSEFLTYNILDILSSSSYSAQFAEGIFVHMDIRSQDYQRFHMPTSGVILDIQNIPCIVPFGMKRKSVKRIVATEGRQCQFVQDRVLIICNNDEIGMFALIPICLVQLSSVRLEVNVGDILSKGQELGFFKGGGADFVVVFSNPKIKLKARIKQPYEQGNKMALVV